jgi:DNA mismatch repair protein MutL
MGFRGEALSSIAAVSELKIETRFKEEETGTEITVSKGKCIGHEEISRPAGTTVTVRDLFSQIPVRKKYMGSSKSELNKILQVVSRISFSHPSLVFQVEDSNRTLLSRHRGTLQDRAAEVFGQNVQNEMIPVDYSSGSIHIQGFIGTPEQCQGRRSSQYFYINNRCVHNIMLAKALSTGYDALQPGKYPVGVLFLHMPKEEVDINVHPTKREIRFLNESRVFASVVNAAKEGLRKILNPPALSIEEDDYDPENSAPNKHHEFIYYPDRKNMESSPVQTSMVLRTPPGPDQGNLLEWPDKDDGSRQPDSASIGKLDSQASSIPYMQIHNSYILFEVKSGLMVINQQAAHERILYEEALNTLKASGRLSSQQLLFPEIIELGEEQTRQLKESLNYFHSLGFDLGYFGGCSFKLRGIPSEVSQNRAAQTITDIVHNLSEGYQVSPELLTKVARAYAKGASIKTGQQLDYPQMANLVNRLFATQNPSISPSGNTVYLPLRLDEFQRRFKNKS